MASSVMQKISEEKALFVAPGPGSWQSDPAHFPRPVTPWTAEVFPAGFKRGFSESTRRYGLLLSHLEPGLVHGFIYYQPIPAGRPGDPTGSAEIEARMETSREAFATQRWREDLDLWETEFKPDSIRRNRGLQGTDVAKLSDAGLAAHLSDCHDNQVEMVYRHHKFNMATLLPVGDFVAQVTEWTGRSHADILELLNGSSPVSNGIAEPELRAVGAALRKAGLGPESFDHDLTSGCILEKLQSMPGEVGEAIRAYLQAGGLHITGGYDVTQLTVQELPDSMLQSFWNARETPASDEDAGLAERSARLRLAVPEEHRAEFDQLLAEARLMNHLRDERGMYNDLWAAGISRRAIQEVGRRLALRGRLDSEDLIFEAGFQEMLALLHGSFAPASRELAERARRRQTIDPAEVPPFLGDEPAPPPPIDGLPPHARRAARAFELAIGEIMGNATEENEERVVRGKAVSPGIYVGRACIIDGPGDFHKVRQGDVLVTTSTSASFNAVLPLLGAIVTDRGALLSHAAIVAREYGIPGVVGTREATRIIKDGARVRVDGGRGIVEVMS